MTMSIVFINFFCNFFGDKEFMCIFASGFACPPCGLEKPRYQLLTAELSEGSAPKNNYKLQKIGIEYGAF